MTVQGIAVLGMGLLVLFSASAQSDPAAGSVSNAAELGLSSYTLEKGPIDIPGGVQNCSGLAFNPLKKTIFVAVNKPTLLLEIALDGKLLRKIDLDGFDDTEDVAWVGTNKLAVIEERRRNLCVFLLPSGARSVAYGQSSQWLVDPEDADNLGLEGVTWDSQGARYFVVKEKTPRKIYAVTPPTKRAPPTVTQTWDIEQQSLACADLSGIHYHAGVGHLLILSDESKCVVECTTDGREIGRLSLAAGSAGLTESLKQPEGITMDAADRLYICSEPNQFYVFSRAK